MNTVTTDTKSVVAHIHNFTATDWPWP